MLFVQHELQLEVLLLISLSVSNPISDWTEESPNVHSVHPMVTRLKYGTIAHQFYKGFYASFPELNTLRLNDNDDFDGGFSFLVATIDFTEPTTFRKDVSMS